MSRAESHSNMAVGSSLDPVHGDSDQLHMASESLGEGGDDVSRRKAQVCQEAALRASVIRKSEAKAGIMRTSSTLIGRLSGLALIVGGLLWAVGGTTALNYESLGITMRVPHLMLSLGGLLSLIGLARLASKGTRHYGRAGLAGLLVASVGVVLIIASKNLPSNISEDAAWNVFYSGGLLLVIGSLLFGIVAWYRKASLFGTPLLAVGGFAILNIVFLMVPAEPGYLGTVVLPILVGLGWTVLGYALWSYEAAPTGVPRSAASIRDGAGLDGPPKAVESPDLPVMEGPQEELARR